MNKKHTICIAGAGDLSHLGLEMIDEAKKLGEYLAEQDVIVHTAAASGFSFWVSKGVVSKKGHTVGFSPAANKDEHSDLYKLPLDPFSSVVYTGLGYPGRNLMMMRSSDALVVGPGQIETFHEFMTALEENKLVGVWEGPWEIDDAVHELIGKKGKTLNVIFEKDPEKLVSRITKILDTNK
jgi:uncharacterized protein (TIGR00725 family)